MSDTIEAPWTDEQVEGLQRWQDCESVHPYTCGYCRDRDLSNNEHELTPTREGWICATCDYTQTWAHSMSVMSEQEARVISTFLDAIFGDSKE